MESQAPKGTTLGGPMLYLHKVFGGRYLAPLYTFICLFFGLLCGNAMQTHSVSLSIQTTWGVDKMIIATVLFCFVLYAVFGGAQRIVAISNKIVPVKVVVFFISALCIVLYHVMSLPEALLLIATSAFNGTAVAGGVVGFSVMQAIRQGMNISITATESGLGTAAILFGYTGDQDPIDSGLLGMISTFVSSLVCFLSFLCSDERYVEFRINECPIDYCCLQYCFWLVWRMDSYFPSVSFGLGVLVGYAYICRATSFAITGGKYEYGFMAVYAVLHLLGAIADVNALWFTVAVMNGILLVINLYGLVYLIPSIAKKVCQTQLVFPQTFPVTCHTDFVGKGATICSCQRI